MAHIKTSALVIIAVVLSLLAVLLLKYVSQNPVIANFDECASAGYPIAESYPEQCRTPDGRTFVNERQVAAVQNFVPEANGCAAAGCSDQLCVEAVEKNNIVTTCEYRPEYACYREARCERQQNGQCGWTETTALQQCLADIPASENVI